MEVGGSATSTGGYSSYKEPARKPYLSMGRVEKELKKQLGREPSEEEISTKYAELKATGKYKELGTGPLGRKNTALNENNITGLPIEDDVRALYKDGLDAAFAAAHIANAYDYHEMERFKEKFEFAPWKGDEMARFNIFIQDMLAQMR
tara:strand:+ start:299 stop:742 length:444 start_codon:yes stop_codon:yes gene_type:complete